MGYTHALSAKVSISFKKYALHSNIFPWKLPRENDVATNKASVTTIAIHY